MPQLYVKYLGTINENVSNEQTVVKKYIAKVTSAELSQWFQYSREKKGGRHPFKVLDSSTIKIHERVQRGKNESGFVLQDKAKIDDIKNTLLKVHKTSKKVYLGSLVWNIREKENNKIRRIKISEDDSLPPEYELRIDVDNIFLTDSAHRHFGIVEAYKEYKKDQNQYPYFDENFEFIVEIYNLTPDEEQNLFNELNAKQKKITAAKQKQLDNSTPLGKIKDAIIDYDMENNKNFYNNIELNSNRNTGYTLMTMSVFVASIKEMFKSEINEADKDASLKDELVQYYCDFFTALKENIQIKYTSFGKDKSIYPFNNLYLEHIYKIENNSDYENEILETKLDEARDKAKLINKEIRQQDLIIHNVSIKALSRLGKLIRKMSNWRIVIEQIQQSLIIGHNGRFLQKSNPEILDKPYKNNKETLATLNEDGSLNMQVVSWKIDDLYNFYTDKLLLQKDTELYCSQNDFSEVINNGYKFKVSKHRETTIQFRYAFYVADTLFDELSLEDISMSVVAINGWNKIKFTGNTGKQKAFKAMLKDYDEGYIDDIYDNGIKKATVNFEIRLPKFENDDNLISGLKIKIKAPNISIDDEREYTFITEDN